MPRPRRLKRPCLLLLECTGHEPDLLGSLQHRARRNQVLFAQLDQALTEHVLPASPVFEPLGPLLRTLANSRGPAFRDAPVTAVPLLI